MRTAHTLSWATKIHYNQLLSPSSNKQSSTRKKPKFIATVMLRTAVHVDADSNAVYFMAQRNRELKTIRNVHEILTSKEAKRELIIGEGRCYGDRAPQVAERNCMNWGKRVGH